MALADLFDGIADAIREKDGTTAAITANNFPQRVRAIQTGINTSNATATANDIRREKTAYAKGKLIYGAASKILVPDFKTVSVNAEWTNGVVRIPKRPNNVDILSTENLIYGTFWSNLLFPNTVIANTIISWLFHIDYAAFGPIVEESDGSAQIVYDRYLDVEDDDAYIYLYVDTSDVLDLVDTQFPLKICKTV